MSYLITITVFQLLHFKMNLLPHSVQNPNLQSSNTSSNGVSQVLALLHITFHMSAAYIWDLRSFSARNRNVLHDSRFALWTLVVSNGTGVFCRTTDVFMG